MRLRSIPFLLIILLTSCVTRSNPTPAFTATFTPRLTSTFTSEPVITPTMTLVPTQNPYIILNQLFTCGDGIIDISTNGSFNGLFKPEGYDQYHGHMDIYPPDGCDISNDQIYSPITGSIERYEFNEPDIGGTNWGYKITFPYGIYPSGIENAFSFAGVDDFDLSQVSQILIDIGHVNCEIGEVTIGEPICTIVPMPAIYGSTRVAINIGISLKNSKEYMFTPTLFDWTGDDWSCDKVLVDGYCEPQPNFYKPETR